jgi:hypothetical protein
MRTLDDHEASEATQALRLAYLLADPVELIHHVEAALTSCSTSTRTEHHSKQRQITQVGSFRL